MSEHPTENKHRPIRSFVRREGRLTRGQQRAMDELWPRYGVDTPGVETLEPERRAMAIAGIEVHRPGVGTLLRLLGEADLHNVRVVCDDAVQVLKHHLPDACLDRVQLYFPDPWHKKRHHKRRIVSPGFAALVAQKLKPGGIFHLATDWQDYAEQMLAVMEVAQGYRNLAGEGEYSPRPGWRPLTKFEQRGQRLGHGVWDLLFERIAEK